MSMMCCGGVGFGGGGGGGEGGLSRWATILDITFTCHRTSK